MHLIFYILPINEPLNETPEMKTKGGRFAVLKERVQ
jgi:hypothetical protein